jgi:(p)ppGpp synthase/HD superfamily hydrolase
MKNHQRVSEGFALAASLHQDQTRKVGNTEDPALAISYITHLAEVFAFVIQGFGDDDQMIAALLHDAIEDQPVAADGRKTTEVIEEMFGPRVLELVLASSEARPAPGQPKAPWQVRKENHLTHLRELAAKDPSVLLVGLADKLSNGQAIVNDLNLRGSFVWDRFNAPATQVVWYYESMLKVFKEFIPDNPLVPRLESVVEQMRELAV